MAQQGPSILALSAGSHGSNMRSRKDLSKVVLTAKEPGSDGDANAVCRLELMVLVLFLGIAAPSRGYPATLSVCASGCKYTTIAAAIAAAKAGDTINVLDAVHSESNITVDRNLTIQGQGAAKTTVDGAENGTVFTTNAGVTSRIQNLTIAHGFNDINGGGVINDGMLTVTGITFFQNSTGGFEAPQPNTGGGIFNDGTLTVSNSTFSGNGSLQGGGVFNDGDMTVTNSTFSSVAIEGGAIYNKGTAIVANSTFSDNSAEGGAGGTANYGTLIVTNSTFSDNFSENGLGGGIANNGTLIVTDSTFSGNFSPEGGGIFNDGTLTVTNSTFFANSADGGGGIANNGTGGNDGMLTVTNSTFLANSAAFDGEGGSVLNSGATSFKNTILAGSSLSGNCSGTISDAGYNISDDTSCGFVKTGSANNGDGVNPLFSQLGLANNGGPTGTIALDSESPAIDAIPLADCTDQNSNPIHADQRGALRPDPGEVACDIGAYEFQDFAGLAKCSKKSEAALVQQYGSLSAAASAYGFSTVKQLKAAVHHSCGG